MTEQSSMKGQREAAGLVKQELGMEEGWNHSQLTSIARASEGLQGRRQAPIRSWGSREMQPTLDPWGPAGIGDWR